MKSAKPSSTVPSQASAPRSWRHRAWALLLAVTPLGAACDFIAQKDLTPGQSTEADVRRWMGQPEMIWEESDGSRTLEYPRGPMGKETYFVTIGADGRYRRIEQVLTEENFRKVQPGMTRDQVRQILGKPGEISRFKRQNEEVWGWRYLEATQRTMFFYAHFDQDTGLLKRTDQMQDWKTSKR
jgi:probable lipoprotein